MKAVYAALSLMLAASLAWAGSSRELQICDRSEAETGRPSCRPELGNDPSAYDNRCPYWDEFHIERTQQSAESEYGYWVSSGNPPARDNAISSPLEIDQGHRQVEEAELSASVPEASSYDPGRGWPPPEEAASLTAESDHCWPPSAQVLPPLEFDGGQPNPKARRPPVVAWQSSPVPQQKGTWCLSAACLIALPTRAETSSTICQQETLLLVCPDTGESSPG